MNRSTAVIPLFCVVVAAWPCAALASDGVESIATGMRAMARGGADVAVGDTALSQIDNPATLSLMPRSAPRVDGMAEIAFIDILWRGPLGTDQTRRVIPLTNNAISIPINERLTLGAAFHSKGGLMTNFSQRHLLIPFMKRHTLSDLKVMSLPLNVAYKVTDKLSIGGGLRLEFASARFETVLGPAAVEFGRGETFGGGFDLGLLYKIREDLTFGLGYRSPTWSGDLEGGNGRASLLGVLPVPLGNVSLDSLRLPQKVSAGVAWDVTERLKLVGEARWVNYRGSSLHSVTIQADGLLDIRLPLPLGYGDVWAFMVGPQYQLSEHWKVACGYHYASPAVSPRNLLPEGSVVSRHHATAGLWYETRRWWVGLAYVIAFPDTLRADGRTCIPFGIDYAHSSLTHMQQAITVGFGYQW